MDLFDLVAKISLDSSEYEHGLDNAKDKASRWGGALGKVAKAGAAAIGVASTAVTAFAGASVNVGMDFDKSMSQVAATMGTTVDQIQNLRDFALEMGSKTAFSATEASEALNYMALAGYDANTSMSMLPNVLNLAAAGSIDLARASDMITDAQSALGLTLEETSAMVDQMAAASSSSNTSVEQLGDAFLTIGATARNLSGGTEELATVLGVLADNGIKGAEGGTHLRNMILSLQNPTDDAAAMLKALGISVYDADGNMRSMIDIVGDLQGSLDGMDQASKDAIVSGIFNKTDLAAVNALLGTSSDRFDELSGKISNSAGAAEKMANTQLDNLAGDITLFKSALEGAQITISDVLTPKLREFVQFGTNAIGTLSTAFQEGGLTGAMDALGTILSDGLSMIIEELPSFVNAGVQLLSSLGSGIIDNAPLLVDAAIEIIGTLADGLIENLPGMFTAITDIILVIVDRLTQPAMIDRLVSGALGIILALVTGIVQNLPRIVQAATEIIQSLVEYFKTHWDDIKAVGVELLEMIAEGIRNTLVALWDLGGEVVDAIGAGISAAWDGLVGWFNGLWNNLFGGRNVDVNVNGHDNIQGSHAIGLDYVPFNGYIAELHRGEAVLTSREASDWRRGNSNQRQENNQPITIVVQSVLDGKVVGESVTKYQRNRARAFG